MKNKKSIMNNSPYQRIKINLIVLILISMFGITVFATPQVVSVSPAPEIIRAPANTQIVVDFNTAVDSQSVNSNSLQVFGRWSGVMPGSFMFEDNHRRVRFSPAGSFSAGERVTVSLSKDIADTSGQTMAAGYAWKFWIESNATGMSLQEIAQISVRQPGEGWIQTYGAYAGDLNNDGYTDYSVPNEVSADVRVFLNDSQGNYSSFTVHPISNGSSPSTNEGADFNQDGNIDIAVGNIGNDLVSVFLGDGTGEFQSTVNYPAGEEIRGLTVLDVEGDGDTDIATANFDSNNLSILLNNGNGAFASSIQLETTGNGERSIAAADANEDGIMDLIVGAYSSTEMMVLLGDGNGNFQLSHQVSILGRPWMIAVGDVNNDGHVDVVSANTLTEMAAVIHGDGNGHLIPDTSYQTGGNIPLAIDLGDLDGDGDLDMIASNFSGNWRLWENDGIGNFINAQDYPSSTAASCAVFHDRDNDGDLDMTGIDEIDDLLILFENRPTAIGNHQEDPGLSDFELSQNYPNPFNPSTEIRYRLTTASEVKLSIYNLLGQKILTLVDSGKRAGIHSVEWNGRNRNGIRADSGVYFYKLEVNNSMQTRKMILLR